MANDLPGAPNQIDGDVRNPVTITFEQLLAMDLIERDITLTCVSSRVGGQYVGSTRWLDVRLSELLKGAGIGQHSDQILSESTEGFTISTPLSVALDPARMAHPRSDKNLEQDRYAQTAGNTETRTEL